MSLGFYWIIGSFTVETFLSSIIWLDDFEAYISKIRGEIYRKFVRNEKIDSKKLEDLRIQVYIAALILISKVNAIFNSINMFRF